MPGIVVWPDERWQRYSAGAFDPDGTCLTSVPGLADAWLGEKPKRGTGNHGRPEEMTMSCTAGGRKLAAKAFARCRPTQRAGPSDSPLLPRQRLWLLTAFDLESRLRAAGKDFSHDGHFGQDERPGAWACGPIPCADPVSTRPMTRVREQTPRPEALDPDGWRRAWRPMMDGMARLRGSRRGFDRKHSFTDPSR